MQGFFSKFTHTGEWRDSLIFDTQKQEFLVVPGSVTEQFYQ